MPQADNQKRGLHPWVFRTKPRRATTWRGGAGAVTKLPRQVRFDVTGNQCVHVQLSSVSFRDAVGAVGVFHEVESLAQLHQTVDQLLVALEMYIVIAGSVN